MENNMDQLIVIIGAFLNIKLLILLIMGGIFIPKYTTDIKVKHSYKILIFSVLLCLAFYFLEGGDRSALTSYLFTYLTATSFNELIGSFITEKITESVNKEETPKPRRRFSKKL